MTFLKSADMFFFRAHMLSLTAGNSSADGFWMRAGNICHVLLWEDFATFYQLIVQYLSALHSAQVTLTTASHKAMVFFCRTRIHTFGIFVFL
jgi:hypothetical protein